MITLDDVLTDAGFVAPTYETIRADRETDLRSIFGASLPLGDNTLLGHIEAIDSEREALLWDLGQANYNAGDPDAATGPQEDAICAITGTTRAPARASSFTALGGNPLTLTGTPSTLVSAGSQAKTLSTGALFATIADATIALLASWTATTAYTLGARVTNVGRTYVCTVSGTSASSGGPATPLAAITDNTVTWRYMGDGTGAVDVDAQSTINDAIQALSGDLTVIQTPIGGWIGVINLEDVTLGAPVQTDQALRVTREAELAGDGAGTPDAIRAKVLEVPGVTTCTVFYNNTDAPVTSGGTTLPAHSVEVLVQGGADQAVSDALLAVVACPADLYGTYTPQSSVDSEGVAHVITFSRPTAVTIYVRLALTVSDALPTAGGFPTNGVSLVQAAVPAFGNAQPAGKDAVPRSIGAQAFTVQGVDDVQTAVYTDVIGAPVAWAASTAYVATVGARSVVTADGGRQYICVQSGTSAGSGGPSGVASAVTDPTTGAYVSGGITDGGAIWSYLGAVIAIDRLHLALFDSSRVAVTTTAGDP